MASRRICKLVTGQYRRCLWGGKREEGYRLSMSETISTSSSAAAIFSADDSCGRPPNRKDMIYGVGFFGVDVLCEV